ncbi:Short-chain dehydrogenase/reductase prx6 [Fulvia fulva]|uniref:Short-chain dehydrogenase/reductase prx6 n=1 Tax=Passalora fulva TaxID=5499 RepID=A0A9Q8P3M6_PASFU|nr:Short-chain dehydrogenase/reductase prx6 [Fulvia fulva]KAK4636156.1 Short-chain dehydrogenase/reductase prx6 [Fulvia fulva]KAK4637172.1 Short-chain dehydrogenase/reductase prx6 [Fulvia fulva]UJO11852.1 Short-chain dehydrogenase/reductase prx6 [Fulvia fulva]WPV10356.1 Short-chain dehydrogenase/reductase prx6 [Fulvia fulva]WPV24820.1 Short-chain dehydrogenase/reductase prx6 [Fulvia fulva]
MAPPVALITGASSGIGLALTKHLLARDWNVVTADLHAPPETLGEDTLFIQTDISSWSSNVNLFHRAYNWHSRLDFVALNAGIDDRDDIFNSISSTQSPKQPNMATFRTNLLGTYYGIKLAAHYLSLFSPLSSGKSKPGGRIVITASAAGIYPLPNVPQYTATKHALIGLARAMAPAAREVNITINAVCPALVKTNLAPPGMLESFAEEEFTPMSTIIRCFSELADLEKVNDERWVEGGKNGEVVEGNMEDMMYHYAPARPESSSYVDEEGQKAWARAYLERNKAFAAKL